MLHFPSMQAPHSVDLNPPGRSPLDTCSLGQVGPASRLRASSPPSRFSAPFGGDPENVEISSSRARLLAQLRAARQDAPNTLATSTFSPGPMVEDSDTRLM